MALRPVRSDIEDVNTLWKAVQEEARAIRGLSIGARSATLTVAFTGAGTQAINHKLGRVPVGWAIVDKDATCDVWRTAWTSTTLTLQSSAAVNLSVEVW